MKILLVGNYIHDLQTSMQLFGKTLETGIMQLGHEVLLIRPEPFFGRLKPSYRGIGKWLGYIDKFILFPPRLYKALSWADVVHICDHSNAFYTRYLKNIPHLVTCHDMLAIRSALGEFKENPTNWTGRRLQRMILNGLKIARHIACITEATKNDILRLTGLNPKDFLVIYYGFNYPYSPMEKQESENILTSIGIEPKTPFFLHVGKDTWYKNRIGALDIFRCVLKNNDTSRFNLVFVGDNLSKEMRKFIVEHDLKNKIFEIAFAEGETLRALYSAASALLYPSLEEGFGWPIIEAQACGCPVFTSGRPPMTEVGGDAAVYIDPLDPEEAARAIVETLNSAGKVANMREAGFLNIKRFSTKEMISKYIRVYEGLRK